MLRHYCGRTILPSAACLSAHHLCPPPLAGEGQSPFKTLFQPDPVSMSIIPAYRMLRQDYELKVSHGYTSSQNLSQATKKGLVRWLSGSEYWRFFQSTQVQFPGHTWPLTTVSNYSSAGSASSDLFRH